MKYWKEYKGHEPEILGKRKRYDNTIYSFDIETSSYIILDEKIIPACDYESLTEKEKDRAIKQSNMYIWMLGINKDIYYGRTWEEFKLFLAKLYDSVPELKYVFIHNLAFEFQYLKSVINIDSVNARVAHKPMKALCKDFNIEFRCTYMMSNCSLAKLPKLFNLPVEKKVGDLDYDKLRHSETTLTDKELGYCEYDCLVVYEYIKYELKSYDSVKTIPITSTGHVRTELKELVRSNFKYKKWMRRSINTDPHIYNLLIKGFAGGITHANWIYADEIIKNVDSWDFTSSYPYCMVVEKYPSTKFKPINITDIKQMNTKLFAYLVVIRLTNVKSRYYNHFISKSKCTYIKDYKEDNGRIIEAKELELVLTDVDLEVILEAYECSYEILECFYSVYNYLPPTLINFILDKYVKKTVYKNNPEYELEYSKEKSRFNSIYGMTVTNEIRDEVEIHNGEWIEIPLSNSDILDKLNKQEKDGFLSFSTGVWVTAYARRNLEKNIMKLDEYVVYCDTDSIKVCEGYDKQVIEDYNKQVLEKLKAASKYLGIPLERFSPKDVKGVERPLGVFDSDGHYEEFITQGAKKYAVKVKEKNKETGEIEEHIKITVSGVPKSGAKCLNGDLNNFRDDLVFDHKYTNKNLLMYCEEQREVILSDYNDKDYKVSDKSGCCILPTTYVLGKAEDYAHLLSDESSKRAIFKE